MYVVPVKYRDPTGHCPGCFNENREDERLRRIFQIYRTQYGNPFEGNRPAINQRFGPNHNGIDFDGELTVIAPAGGTVKVAQEGRELGVWKFGRRAGEGEEVLFHYGDDEIPIADTREFWDLTVGDRDQNSEEWQDFQSLLADENWVDIEPGWSHEIGTWLHIEDPNGLRTIYYHVVLEVSVYDEVEQGGRLGTSANIGKSTGVHLHYTVQYENSSGEWITFDPMLPRWEDAE